MNIFKTLQIAAEAGQSSQAQTTETKPETKLFDINSGQRVNVEVRAAIVKLITNTIKMNDSMTGRLFRLVRECGDYGVAVGTFAGAEADACKEHKVKTINQLSKAFNGVLGTYLTIKSQILGAIHESEDLALSVQALWNWEHEKEGAEAKFLPVGFLNAFSDRYQDATKGATLFMADLRLAKPATMTLQGKKAIFDRQAAKNKEAGNNAQGSSQPAGGAATNGPSAGIAGGTGGEASDMDKDTLTAVKDLVHLLHEVYRGKAVSPVELRQWMYARMADLRQWDTSKRTAKGMEPLKNEIEPGTLKQVQAERTELLEKTMAQGTEAEGAAVKAIPEEEPELPEVDDVLGDDLTDEDKALIAQHAPPDDTVEPKVSGDHAA